MKELTEIRVKIKEELKRRLVFGVESRLPIGIMLGFAGYRHEILPLMQILSHETRAYICNANGLPGFISELSLIETLNGALQFGHLQQAKKCQVLDLKIIQEHLSPFQTVSQKMNHLKQFYPSLYMFMLKHLKKNNVLE